jgi:hypothetical protein
MLAACILKADALLYVACDLQAASGTQADRAAGGYLFTPKSHAAYCDHLRAVAQAYAADAPAFVSHVVAVDKHIAAQTEESDFNLAIASGVRLGRQLREMRPALATAGTPPPPPAKPQKRTEPGSASESDGGDQGEASRRKAEAKRAKRQRQALNAAAKAGWKKPGTGPPPYQPPPLVPFGQVPAYPPPYGYVPPPPGPRPGAPLPPGAGPGPPGHGAGQGNSYQAMAGGNPSNPQLCHDFRAGNCSRQACKFRHAAA